MNRQAMYWFVFDWVSTRACVRASGMDVCTVYVDLVAGSGGAVHLYAERHAGSSVRAF
jgi:hypothetical protein